MRDFNLRITGPNKAEIIDLSNGDTINLGPFDIVGIRVRRKLTGKQPLPPVKLTLRVRETVWEDFHEHADENLNTRAYVDKDTLRLEVATDLSEYVRLDEVRAISIKRYNAEHEMINGRGGMYLELPLYPNEVIEVPEEDTRQVPCK